MPVEYDYDPKANVIHVYPYAELSVSEIYEYFARHLQDDAIAYQSIEVVHFDKVEKFMFSSEEAGGITENLANLREEKSLLATILVGKHDYHYGIARMMQILIEMNDPGYTTSVVCSDKELQRAIRDISG